MNPKSTPAKSVRKHNYGIGTSRGTRSLDNLRTQMADLERGRRIKTARDKLHLTQPAVVELFAERAPDCGLRPVTLRGYQAWEGGGGIKWPNAKLLAGVLGLHPDYMMTGRVEPEATPDPFAAASQLDRIENNQRRILDALEIILVEVATDEVAKRLEDVLHAEAGPPGRARTATARIARATGTPRRAAS
jgi:transcriptional regulator with XRE-family HTH domain